MSYIYRKLSIEDTDMILEMNRNFRAGFANQESLREFLSDPQNWFFAAIHDGAIIGFTYGYALQRLDREQTMLYIHEVGVMDAYQRQGIGYAMMKALLEECGKRNICKCFLTTYQNNTAANALYRKLGGQVPAESQGKDTVYYFQIR